MLAMRKLKQLWFQLQRSLQRQSMNIPATGKQYAVPVLRQMHNRYDAKYSSSALLVRVFIIHGYCADWLYIRYKQLLDERLVDVLQPDIAWLGGLTEAKKVVAMAAASNTIVVPHCSGVFSFHLVRTCIFFVAAGLHAILKTAIRWGYVVFVCMFMYTVTGCGRTPQVLSSPNCPMSEYPALNPRAEAADVGLFKGLFEGEPLPQNGFIDVPNKPGFGVELIRDNLHRPYPRSAEESRENAAANIAEKVAQRSRPARMRL